MTVHDCLKAYKSLGKRVFGSPRPPLGIAWHKFDATLLEEVIRDVVSQHSEHAIPPAKAGDILYPSPEAFCKT